MDVFLRLCWALPMVLVTGVVAILVLKRFGVPLRAGAAPKARIQQREALSLSDDTRVHLIELDGVRFVVVESTRNAVVQAMPVRAR